MKAYYKRPRKELIVVKPDSGVDEYEFYVITPRLIGTAVKAGTQRILCEGKQFTNLNNAVMELLEKSGEKDPDLLADAKPWMKKSAEKLLRTGVDLVARGVWAQFCEMRKLATTHDNIGRQYYLTADEAKALGLSNEIEQPAAGVVKPRVNARTGRGVRNRR